MNIAITRKKKRKHKGLCSNLNCLAPLEPPFNVYEFQIEGERKGYSRMFCIDCIDVLLHSKRQDVCFEVYEQCD